MHDGGTLESVRTEGTVTLANASPQPVGVIVRVRDAPAVPPELRLHTGVCVIGSGVGSDIVVSDPAVSRQHVELSLVPEGVLVRDLTSRNGTYFRGQRVERMRLGLGTELEIGRATIEIRPDEDELAGADYAEDEYGGIVGASPPMKRLFAVLRRLEGSLVPVMVHGESGVGKELVGRALHRFSARSSGPFVAINCGALPRELVGSELFGHRKGAFTGATDTRRGAFESADGGTLFLDEIGELPLEVQPMLLRALEVGEVRPVGADAVRHVDVRVIAATNRDLMAEVKAARFRHDVYYRLAVVRLTVPPLRERPGDVAVLARRFARDAGVDLPEDVVLRFGRQAWPGNVRELRNAVLAWAAVGELAHAEPASSPADLESALAAIVDLGRTYGEQKDALVDRFTQAYLEALMRHTHGNQSAAAKLAGLDRTYLGRLLAKYPIEP